VAELRKVIQDVAAKLASGANDAADDAVHDVGHLLEDLDTLVGKQDVAADVKEATKKAVAELMDCFDKVDQAMHASKDEGESPSAVHASVTERIAAAMASLEKQIKGRKTPTEHKE
jgi:histidinol dehydrogenase